ncbi:MAG: hypothetical protein SFV81_07470 [Pirellulaceae bacterium]|nr:hypothetical protein [Pirellulaceae bacterium]
MSKSTVSVYLFAVLWLSTQLSNLPAQDLSKLRGYAKPGPNPNSPRDLTALLEFERH